MLQIEQFALDVESAAITAKRAVGRNYAMTRYDDCNGIPIVRHAHGAKGLRMSNGMGDITIAAGLPVRDVEQGVPAFHLESGTPQIDRERESFAMATKIFVEFASPRGEGLKRLLPGLAGSFGELAAVEFEFEQSAIGAGE